MNECERIQELLSAMLDGEVTPAERADVEAHVAHCPECRAALEAFTALHGALASAEELPADLHGRVMDRVRGAERARARLRRRRVLRPVMTAAACLAVIVGAALVSGGLHGQSKSADMAARTAAEGFVSMDFSGGSIMTDASTSAESEPAEVFNSLQADSAADCVIEETAPAGCAVETAAQLVLSGLVRSDKGMTGVVERCSNGAFAPGDTVEVRGETEPVDGGFDGHDRVLVEFQHWEGNVVYAQAVSGADTEE